MAKNNLSIRFEDDEKDALVKASNVTDISISQVVRLCVKRSLPTLSKSYGGARKKFLEELNPISGGKC